MQSIIEKKHVKIFDTTLRDGEQTPGVSFNVEEKIEIARRLDELGVDVIEAGFPIVSEGELAAIKAINHIGLKHARICALSRPEKGDIDCVVSSETSHAHIFLATSDLHLKYKLKLSRDQAKETAVRGIEYARARGLSVEFGAEDATRSDREFLSEILNAVVQAGAERVNIADTVGICTPETFADLIRFVRSRVDVPIGIHCHNDYGLAVANSLSGFVAGADQCHVTVNGIGERAGNTSLEEFVMAASRLYDFEIGINPKLLFETSKLVSRLSNVPIQPNKAIVGDNAFGHESGIHTHGVLTLPATYEPMEPELVGATRRIQAGKHAGSHGISSQLKELGISASREQTNLILAKVKDASDQGLKVSSLELDNIARNVLGLERRKSLIRVHNISVTSEMEKAPTVVVVLSVGGEDPVSIRETGMSPVDSALNAVEKYAKQELCEIKLNDYRAESMLMGKKGIGMRVTIKVEDDSKHASMSSAFDPDIVVASVRAFVQAINEIALLRSRTAAIVTSVSPPSSPGHYTP